jgi:hypothetical protein
MQVASIRFSETPMAFSTTDLVIGPGEGTHFVKVSMVLLDFASDLVARPIKISAGPDLIIG